MHSRMKQKPSGEWVSFSFSFPKRQKLTLSQLSLQLCLIFCFIWAIKAPGIDFYLLNIKGLIIHHGGGWKLSSKLDIIKHTIVLKEPKVEMIRSTLGRQKKQSIRRKVTSAEREIHSLFTPTTDTLTTGTQIAQSQSFGKCSSLVSPRCQWSLTIRASSEWSCHPWLIIVYPYGTN